MQKGQPAVQGVLAGHTDDKCDKPTAAGPRSDGVDPVDELVGNESDERAQDGRQYQSDVFGKMVIF